MGKLTNVVLENKTLSTTQEFEINHAERLLRMPNNGGWVLPKDSPYIFSTKNGIGFRPNKKEDTGKEESSDSK
jgi:hypothetical protein